MRAIRSCACLTTCSRCDGIVAILVSLWVCQIDSGACRKALEALRRLIFFLKQSLLIVADSPGRGQHGRSLQSELPWPLSIDE